MSDASKKPFSFRAFVSVMVTLSFIMLSVTGIVLFIAPPGRITNWSGWTIVGLDKHQWSLVHICFSISFLVMSLLHIYLNWRILIGYFKSRLSRRFALRWDWSLALVLCLVLFFGSWLRFWPFSEVYNFHEDIKNSWETQQIAAPLDHAELLTLSELADRTGANLFDIIQNLQARDIHIGSPDIIVEDLAQNYNLSPAQLYNIALGSTGTGLRRNREINPTGAPETEPGQKDLLGSRPGQGTRQGLRGGGGQMRGMGRLTLKQYCQTENFDIEKALKKLAAAGVIVHENMSLREIADQLGVHPSEIQTIIER